MLRVQRLAAVHGKAVALGVGRLLAILPAFLAAPSATAAATAATSPTTLARLPVRSKLAVLAGGAEGLAVFAIARGIPALVATDEIVGGRGGHRLALAVRLAVVALAALATAAAPAAPATAASATLALAAVLALIALVAALLGFDLLGLGVLDDLLLLGDLLE
ncbi:MAG: hypothetical protein J0H63_15525, partial [Rhizobiales bacterium]|nr:hypothetical protein [Hyphomicrobiales bacterium]